MTQPFKACPRCQTPAPLDAAFCPQCQHKYRTQFVPASSLPPQGDPMVNAEVSRRKWLLVVGGIGIVLLLGAGVRAGMQGASLPTISVNELRQNALRYDGQTVKVVSYVTDPMKDLLNIGSLFGDKLSANAPTHFPVLQDVRSADTQEILLSKQRDFPTVLYITPQPIDLSDRDHVEVVGVYESEKNLLHVKHYSLLAHRAQPPP